MQPLVILAKGTLTTLTVTFSSLCQFGPVWALYVTLLHETFAIWKKSRN